MNPAAVILIIEPLEQCWRARLMPQAIRNYISCSDMDDRRAMNICNKNGLEVGIPAQPDGFCHQLPGTLQGY
ncbi:hypothetical protein JH26_20700 [Microvirga sp. BSC39]|nr:hypothetical protein JH26_20700 [Microvirga sp. BSC39]